jgi:hypothetical protein
MSRAGMWIVLVNSQRDGDEPKRKGRREEGRSLEEE